MLFFDPEKPEEFVRDLIDRVNRGEALSEAEMFTMSSFFGYKAVYGLLNPTGRRIITGDANVLPL